MLIAACDIPPNALNKIQEENGNDADRELQGELSRERHVSSGTEELQSASQEVPFYNKDSSLSRPSSASSLSSVRQQELIRERCLFKMLKRTRKL